MDSSKIDFSIVTPSFNMLKYLKSCHASIKDQKGVVSEHIVLDAVSHDGTPEWLRSQDDIVGIIENDDGMYDAINRGYDRAKGEFIAHLNCDEQYLPGTLSIVKSVFNENPNIDVLFGGAIMVSPKGDLIALRRAYKLRWVYLLASMNLDVLTCGIFMRRRTVIDQGFRYNSAYRSIGDIEFVRKLLQSGLTFSHIPQYLSVFFFTGNNLSRDPISKNERLMYVSTLPAWLYRGRKIFNAFRHIEKMIRGVYTQSTPLGIEFYLPGETEHRNPQMFYSVPGGWSIFPKTSFYPLANRKMLL